MPQYNKHMHILVCLSKTKKKKQTNKQTHAHVRNTNLTRKACCFIVARNSLTPPL